MEQSVVVTQLDRATMAWLVREAARTGEPIEAVARRLIYRGLEAENQGTRQLKRYHDLDALAGTWSAEEVEEFQQASVEFEQVDPSVWQ